MIRLRLKISYEDFPKCLVHYYFNHFHCAWAIIKAIYRRMKDLLKT